MRTLDELNVRREELARLNRELEETNRGVVALYAELDERAEELRRNSEAKSGLLSSVSHELRTPLSSILALCDLLLGRADGPLTEEQERQIAYIRVGAESLLPLVNDLLDLARIEAGKTVVHAGPFAIEDLFASLRGMFRPLHHDDRVSLVFEPAGDLPTIRSDESKVAQVLRNLVSNALKFTLAGEVRVCARLDQERRHRDVHRRRHRSRYRRAMTGSASSRSSSRSRDRCRPASAGPDWGWPVSQRLAAVLGGAIRLDSEPGVGSTFTLSIPVEYSDAPSARAVPGASRRVSHPRRARRRR